MTSGQKNRALSRLSQIKDAFTSSSKQQEPTTMPWDPDANSFPTRKNLPPIEGAPEGAAWFWGRGDYKGRVNLLTPTRVKEALKEVKTGEIVTINLPLNHPNPPAFKRQVFKHRIETLIEGIAFDDLYDMNTQSGSQWDGLRHVGATAPAGKGGIFYNNTRPTAFTGDSPDPNQCSIHHWSEHGIAGRGVLLDFRAYARANGIDYSPNESFPITYDMLDKCGKAQGINIKPHAQGGDIKIGDILLVRSGWTETYFASSQKQRDEVALKDPNTFAGVAQETAVLDWLHDCYFAAVGGDAPAFECWPTQEKWLHHQFILPLWGMPLGEMFDLEKLAVKCRDRGQWTFFFTSVPANCVGGVGSHVNGQCIL